MSFRRYESYRDSGTGWIGQLPAHWQTRRLRTLVEIKKRIAGLEGADVLSITQRGIKVRDLDSNDGQLAENYAHYQRVEVGDFAMNHMDLLTGWVDLSEHTGVTSPDYRVFSLRSRLAADPRYLLRTLQNAYSQRVFYAFGQGASHLGRWRLPTDAFQDFEVPLPPMEEQRTIVAFLDRETAKIDALVEEQRRLIELLKEKRQAVISRAVTKGLHPAAPMKASGVEWLGEVPAHWEVMALKRLIRLQSGESITSEAIEDDGEYAVYGGNGLRGYSERFTHEGDYVLIGRQGALCGNINYASGRFWASEHALVAHPIRKFSRLWLGELLRTMSLGQYSMSAAQPGLSAETLSKLPCPVPPLHEQEQISQALLKEKQISQSLLSVADASIGLLQERRAALISAAVTGKIDVRDAAANAEAA